MSYYLTIHLTALKAVIKEIQDKNTIHFMALNAPDIDI